MVNFYLKFKIFNAVKLLLDDVVVFSYLFTF